MKNFIFILLMCCISGNLWAQTTVSITVLDDPEIRCKNIPIVKIKITPNPAQPYTQIKVDWGDGSPIATFNNNNPNPITTQHDYTSSTLTFIGCAYNCTASSLVDGFCRRIEVLAEYSSIPDENVSKIITFHIPPVPEFSITPNPVCLGQSVSFTDLSCPVSSSMDYTWHFDDGTPDVISLNGTIVPPPHIYTTAGQHTVTLTTSNSCGSATVSHSVNVLLPPTAIATFAQNPSSGCIPLDVSFNNTSTGSPTLVHLWNISPATGWNWSGTPISTPASVNPKIRITEAGIYNVTLTVTNTCGSSSTTQSITAIKKPTFTLPAIPAACAPFSNTLSLTNLDMGGTNSVTYNWTTSSPNLSITGGTTASPTISGTVAGTYTVTVAVSNTCGTTTAIGSVTVSTQGGLSIALPSAVPCVGAQAIQLTANTTGGTWGGCANAQGQVPATAANNGCNATYSVSTGACSGSTNISVVISPPPVPTASSLPVCVGSALNLNASGGTSYSWVGPNNYVSSSQNPSMPNSVQNMSGIYTVTVTSAQGCTATATANAVINVIPTITTTSPVSACNTATAFALQASSNPSGSLVWSGANVSNSGVFNAQAAATGSHTVTVTATANGCSKTQSVTVNVTANVVANAGADQTVCPQDAVINLDTQTGVTGGGVWTVSPATAALTGSVFTPALANAGSSYTFTVVLNDADPNCRTQDTKTITIRNLPQPTATAAAACEGAMLSFGVSPAFASYAWAGVGGFSNTTQNPTRSAATGTMAGTYTVTVTDGNGCTNSTTIDAIVNSLPVLTLTAMSICQNSTLFPLVATAPTTGIFVWSGGGVTGSNFDASQAVGSYTVSCTVADANGCTKSGTTTVEITLNPQPVITAVAPLCANAPTIQLVATPSGGVWTGAGASGTIDPTFTPANAATSSGNVITYTTGNGNATCTKTITTTITVRALPLPIATSTPACEGATLNFAVNPVFSTYAWAGAGGFTSTLQNPTRSPATGTMAGVYTVTVTDANSCTNTVTTNAIINSLPVLTLTPMSICQNTTAFGLMASAAVTPPFTYNWSGTGVTSPNFDAGQAVGSYTVSCTVTDGNTCTTNGVTTVTITANPNPSIAAVAAICANAAPIQLVGTPAGGIWVGAGASGTTDPSFTPTVNIIGNNTIYYVTDSTNSICKKRTSVVINVLPLPQIVAQDTAACAGTLLKLFATTSGSVAATAYAWAGPNFTSAVQNPQVTTAAVIGTNNGVYTITITGNNTCTNSATVNVVVDTIPNVRAVPMTICQNTVQLFDMTTGLPNSGGTGSWVAGSTGVAVTAPNKFDASQTIGLYPVIYTFIDSHSCKDTARTTVEITSNNAPVLTAIPLPCLNRDTINLIPYSDRTGGTWTGSGVDTNLSSFNPTTAGVGVHTLTYTMAPNDPVCKKSTTIDVTVKPLPNLALTSNTPCAKDILQFTLTITGVPAGSTYSWTGPNSFMSSVQNPSITNVQSNAIGIYTVTVTGDNACTNTATNQTIVYGLPNTQSNDTTYCRTIGCYNLPFVSISDPLGTFVWSSWDAASAVNTTATPPCFTPTTSGNGAWHGVVTLTDTHGCIGRDTVNITVTEPANLRLSPMIDTVCSGINVTLHALPAGGRWYRNSVGFPDPSIMNDSIVQTATLIGGGLFRYVYSYGDGSCNVKDSVTIFVIALDTISAGTNDSFCISKTPFQLIGQTPQVYTPATAHWENAHVNAAGVYIQNQGITPAGFYTPYAVAGADSSQVIVDTVKFVYTDPVRGCTTTRTKIVTIHPLPVPANAIPDVGCINTLVSFLNNSPNIAVSHWEFSKPVGTLLFSVDSVDVHHVFQDTGVYYVRLEVTSAFGCTASVRDSIHIVAPPYISFTMSHDTICAGLLVTMTNASGGYEVNYTWDYGDGSVQDSVFAPPPHRFAQAECDTTYIVTLTAYNLCKTLTMTDTILIHPLPVPKWERSDDTICSGQLVIFTNHTKGCNTKTYDWTIDGAPWTTDSIPPATRFTADTLTRTYNICLHATGICGDSTVCKTIFVLPTIISAFINKDKDRGCRPLRVNFTQSSGGPTAPQFTYYWDFGDGTTSTLPNPQHVFDSPTRDTFRVLLLVSDGCFADTVSTVVYTFPQPRLSFTHPPYQCATQGMPFTNTSIDPISSVWLFDDGGRSIASNPVHAFAQAGLHTVTLIAKSLQNGCPDTLLQQVLIRANPIITPTVNNSDGCGPLLVRFTTAGAPTGFDYYYTWNFGDGGSAVDTAHVAIAQSVQHLYTQRDTITRFEVGLTIFDQYQCKSDTLYSPILLYPTPTAEFSYTISPVCGVNAVAEFTNLSTSTAGNLRYVWDFGDNTAYANTDSPTHEYFSSSGKTVTLTATNTYTCADSVQHRLAYCDGLFIPSAFSPETGLGEVRLFGAKGLGVKQYTLSVYSRFGNLIWTTNKLEQGLPVERWDGLFNGAIVPEDMYIWKCEAVFENGEIWQGQEDGAGVRQRVGTVTVLR